MLVLHVSQGQKYSTLSVTKANLINLFKVKIELTIITEIDNKGYVNLINNQSVSVLTRYIDIKKNYSRELKANRVIELKWCLGKENSSTLFIKNLGSLAFKKHCSEYILEIQ